jgi:hypothetical protein
MENKLVNAYKNVDLEKCQKIGEFIYNSVEYLDLNLKKMIDEFDLSKEEELMVIYEISSIEKNKSQKKYKNKLLKQYGK